MDIFNELATEAFSAAGFKGESHSMGKYCTLNEYKIANKADEKICRRPCGTYLTLSYEGNRFGKPGLMHELRANISLLIKKLGGNALKSPLVVGLGNAKITADSLGTLTADALAAAKTRTCILKPSVFGETRIESADLVTGAVNQIKPSAVLAVDTLACAGTEKLFGSVQISNAGITPGSGLGNAREPLCENTLGIPVLSLGIPLISYPKYSADSSLCVTPKEIDIVVRICADLLSSAIQKAIEKP